MSQESYKLVSKQEVDDAVKDDPYHREIEASIAADLVKIKELQAQVRELMRPVLAAKGAITRLKIRVKNRTSQKRFYASKIRERIVWEKIQETRTKIGL